MSRLKYERSSGFDLGFAHIIGRTQDIDLAKQLCPNQNSYTRLLTPLNKQILNLELRANGHFKAYEDVLNFCNFSRKL